MPTLLRLARAIDRLNGGLGVVLRWIALGMVLIGAYYATGRYLTPYVGVRLAPNSLNEIQWYLFSVIFLMGAAYGLEKDVHIRVDILYSRQTKKRRALIDLLGSVVFLIPFSLVMLYVVWDPVLRSWAAREVSPDPGGLPRYPIKALILVSFALLVLQGISQAIKDVAILKGIEPEERAPEESPPAVPVGGGGEDGGLGDNGRSG